MVNDYEEILSKYRSANRMDLIPILQEIQEQDGYISEQAIRDLGKMLDISTTGIYSIASFYDGLHFNPHGRIHIRICNGTSCFINRPVNIRQVIEEELKVQNGETSADGKYSLELVDCMGACHSGPLLAVNNEYHSVRSEKDLKRIIEMIRSDE